MIGIRRVDVVAPGGLNADHHIAEPAQRQRKFLLLLQKERIGSRLSPAGIDLILNRFGKGREQRLVTTQTIGFAYLTPIGGGIGWAVLQMGDSGHPHFREYQPPDRMQTRMARSTSTVAAGVSSPTTIAQSSVAVWVIGENQRNPALPGRGSLERNP